MNDTLDYPKGVSTYFCSAQWQELISLLQTLDQRSHVHLFVKTSLHPKSLERLVKEYLARAGMSTNRSNEILRGGRRGMGAIHGVHPAGRPHFDLNWKYDENIVLEPLEESQGEQGCNLLYWGEEYMTFFRRNYLWRQVGEEELRAIAEYFASPHWRNAFDLVLDPRYGHVHVNVETSVHPNVLERFIREAAGVRGWKLHRTLQNVCHEQGVYHGKFMMLFDEPDMSFDMSWIYHKDAILRPAQRQIFPGQERLEYMIVRNDLLQEFLDETPHRMLSEDEIDACLKAIRTLPTDAYQTGVHK